MKFNTFLFSSEIFTHSNTLESGVFGVYPGNLFRVCLFVWLAVTASCNQLFTLDIPNSSEKQIGAPFRFLFLEMARPPQTQSRLSVRAEFVIYGIKFRILLCNCELMKYLHMDFPSSFIFNKRLQYA